MQIFKKYDNDLDGRIKMKEAYLAALDVCVTDNRKKIKNHDLLYLMEMLDKSLTGTISYHEFLFIFDVLTGNTTYDQENIIKVKNKANTLYKGYF